MRKLENNLNSNQRGQSLVEFAISLVILMLLLSGIVDGGRALFTYMALRDAAQEGALYGSTNPADTAGIRARVQISSDTVQDLHTGGDLNITVGYTDNSNICMGTGIIVDVSTPNFTLTMPFLGTIIGTQTIPISASITDTILRPPCGP